MTTRRDCSLGEAASPAGRIPGSGVAESRTNGAERGVTTPCGEAASRAGETDAGACAGAVARWTDSPARCTGALARCTGVVPGRTPSAAPAARPTGGESDIDDGVPASGAPSPARRGVPASGETRGRTPGIRPPSPGSCRPADAPGPTALSPPDAPPGPEPAVPATADGDSAGPAIGLR
ncbi:hypothetical protein Aut01nite_10620 [Actinoplanes utahensis]|nr:hypothetical protein Aut01nite_10620 [Actinoplanes utahensis]